MKENLEEQIKKCNLVEEEIGKIIVGQKQVIHQVLMALLAGGNILLEGVPGLGKTELVKAFAKVVDLSFSRISFTPDLMPADVTGTNLIEKKGENQSFRFEQGPVFANVVLADEINRATPKTQSAMLEAMQEHTVTASGMTYSLPEPFIVLATQNPIENEGTYPLPEAQLDRFMFKVMVEFPSVSELKEIVSRTTKGDKPQLQAILSGSEILELRQLISEMPMADAVMEYGLSIVAATHKDSPYATQMVKQYVEDGASPRAAQAIIKTAKVRAFLNGRYNVSFEDIAEVALPALRHRVRLSFLAMTDDISTKQIIDDVIKQMKETK